MIRGIGDVIMDEIYNFSVKKPDGSIQSLADFKGKTLLIVNTASKCGFASQFNELQKLYEEHKDDGFVVLSFPSDNFRNQEYENVEKTMKVCKLIYNVTFPMFAKVNVKGDDVDPLFKFLTSEKKGLLTNGVKWNFTKFLVNKEGVVIDRFAPQTSPLKIQKKIKETVQ
jgi:glutathione peroxidase